MMLSEKASAFRIENLISKKESVKHTSSNAKKNASTSFSDCEATGHFTFCSSKSSSTSSLNSSLLNECADSSNKSSDNSTSAITYPNRHKKTVPIKIVHDLNNLNNSCHSPIYSTPSNSPPPPKTINNKRKNNQYELNESNKHRKNCADQSLSQASHCTDQYDYSTMTKAKIESYKGNDKVLSEIECFLETDDLWKRFHELGTEMIITKSGRRMFPSLRVSFSGAYFSDKYLIAMDIVPTDCKRYRYAYHRSSWLVAGKADPPVQSRLFIHPDGPFTGETLFKQIISFEKVKLTNNEMDKCGHIVLNSMHKYQPRVHIIKRPDDKSNISNSLQFSSDLNNYDYKTFVFPETCFIAVTAYQNQLITKLKIDSNPFAKGFRDSSRLSDLEKESIEQLIKDNNSTNNKSSTNAKQITNNSSILNSNSDMINETCAQTISNNQHQSQVQLKTLEGMTSMATFFAALSNKAQLQQQQHQRNLMENAHSLMIPNFQLNKPDSLNNSLYQIATAAAMNGFKFNPFAGNIQDEILQKQQQNQLQQAYQASLANFMSFCQENYMQRFVAEKNSQQISGNLNQKARFHPYSKQPISINTSNVAPNATVRSPGSSACFSPVSSIKQNMNPESPTYSSLESPQSSPKNSQIFEGKLSVSPSSSTSSALLSPPISSTKNT